MLSLLFLLAAQTRRTDAATVVFEVFSATKPCGIAHRSTGTLGWPARCWNSTGGSAWCDALEALCEAEDACVGYVKHTAQSTITNCAWLPTDSSSCGSANYYAANGGGPMTTSVDDFVVYESYSGTYDCTVKRVIQFNHCELIGSDGHACWDTAGCELDESGDTLGCKATEGNTCVGLDRDECREAREMCRWDFGSEMCIYIATPSPTTRAENYCASLDNSLAECLHAPGCTPNETTLKCDTAEGNDCAGLSLESCIGNEDCWIDWDNSMHCRPLEPVTWDYFSDCGTSTSDASCSVREPVCSWNGAACVASFHRGDEEIGDCGYHTKIIASKEDMVNVQLLSVNSSPCACEEFCIQSNTYEHWRFNTKKMKCTCIDGHIADTQIVRSNSYISSGALL